jgi:hypothetical protein
MEPMLDRRRAVKIAWSMAAGRNFVGTGKQQDHYAKKCERGLAGAGLKEVVALGRWILAKEEPVGAVTTDHYLLAMARR